jgi:hypothetical protein
VIEQRASAIGRRLEPLEAVDEERHEMGVDLRQVGDLLGVAAVMRQRVEPLGDADERKGAPALGYRLSAADR